MFEKVKKFLNAKRHLEQPVIVNDSSAKSEVKEQPKQPDTVSQDEKILRCYVLYSEYIYYSTATKGSCIYVHVKPGSDHFTFHNIDYVQQVYAENKIPLNKHVSHLRGEEEEVLCIPVKSYMEDLDDAQKQFFKRTAPEVKEISDYKHSHDGVSDRAYDIAVKMGIERGVINPKVWQGPIRLPYNTKEH